MKISRIILSLFAICFSTNIYAAGATVSFSAVSPNAIPTLSTTMLIILSLLLFTVAFKISKQKTNATGKMFVTLLGVSAIVTMSHSVKLITEVNAGGPVGTFSRFVQLVPNNPTVTIEAGQFVDFESPADLAINFTIVVDPGSQCFFSIEGDPCIPANLTEDEFFTGTLSTVNPAGEFCEIGCIDPTVTDLTAARPAAKRTRKNR